MEDFDEEREFWSWLGMRADFGFVVRSLWFGIFSFRVVFICEVG